MVNLRIARNLIIILALSLLVGLGIATCNKTSAQQRNRGHNQVPCWYQPNGSNVTILCANGWWSTTTPDGEVFEGNGMTDPNAVMRGSTIPLDGQGGINIGRGQVAPPTQVSPSLEPGQANAYGLPYRQD